MGINVDTKTLRIVAIMAGVGFGLGYTVNQSQMIAMAAMLCFIGAGLLQEPEKPKKKGKKKLQKKTQLEKELEAPFADDEDEE